MKMVVKNKQVALSSQTLRGGKSIILIMVLCNIFLLPTIAFSQSDSYSVNTEKKEPNTSITKLALKNDKIAQNKLGDFYENQAHPDYEKALYWYEKSANQGYAPAQYNLAIIYEFRNRLNPEYKKSLYWLKKSVNQGYAPAQNGLGMLYSMGRGIPQDNKKALYWFTKSANNGGRMGQYNLALSYKRGDGIKQDYKKAFYWFTKSARQNYSMAYEELGKAYQNANGVEKDYLKALIMYYKALKLGDTNVTEYIEQMNLDIIKNAKKQSLE